jgi:hypothetical protein
LTQHETTAEQSYAGVRSMHRLYPQCDQLQPIDRLRDYYRREARRLKKENRS